MQELSRWERRYDEACSWQSGCMTSHMTRKLVVISFLPCSETDIKPTQCQTSFSRAHVQPPAPLEDPAASQPSQARCWSMPALSALHYARGPALHQTLVTYFNYPSSCLYLQQECTLSRCHKNMHVGHSLFMCFACMHEQACNTEGAPTFSASAAARGAISAPQLCPLSACHTPCTTHSLGAQGSGCVHSGRPVKLGKRHGLTGAAQAREKAPKTC